MAITHVGAAAGTSGTAAITPALPSGLATNDILILVVEQANQATTISNSAGGTWTQITGSPQGTGTAAGVTSAGCQVWWSRYNGTQTAPTVTDAGDHTAGRIYAYRGVDTTTAINASTGAVDATSDTSLSAPGVTTTADDCWVLHACTLMDDAQDFGATWTNANLTGITVRSASFGHAAGNDGRLVLVDGIKAAAGATGNTTNTTTANSVKAMVTLALQPGVVPGAVTLTPTVFDLVAVTVTPTPGQVTTSITPVVVVFSAVELTGAPGPGTLNLGTAVFRVDPVAVTPTPQPVTTTISPAVFRFDPVPPAVPLFEAFNKADGTPLGPDRTWTRRVYLPATEWQIASNQARYGIVSAGADLHDDDLQVPAPNIAGVPDQQTTLDVIAVDVPTLDSFNVSASVLLRFALYDGTANFRGYVAGVSWNDANVPGVPAVWLYLGRYDAHDQLTTLWVDGLGAQEVTLPGTLIARADGDQISARFIHSGIADMAAAATDTTYTDGDVALLGVLDLRTGDTGRITVDNLDAYIAPDEPSTVEIQLVPTIRFSAVPVVFLSGIDAGDNASPPADDYDALDNATPPTSLNDPEIGLADAQTLTVRFDAVPLAPVGTGPSQTPITSAVVAFAAVTVTPTAQPVITVITPAVFRVIPGNTTGPIIEIPAPRRLHLVSVASSQQLVAVGSPLSLTALEDT